MDGEELRRRREEVGLTADQVAECLGRVGPNRRWAVSRWERGERPIPLAEVSRLRTIFRKERRKLAAFRRRLRDQLPALTPRQREVMSLRYGLNNGVMRTLEDVGQDTSPPMSRQRVSEIEQAVLKRLE